MALDVSDDSKVLNIDMVHANIMQVDITMEDMKEEESMRSNPTTGAMLIITVPRLSPDLSQGYGWPMT